MSPLRQQAAVGGAKPQSSRTDVKAIVGPDLLPGRYVNELSDASPELTRSIYGDAKLDRLRTLKRVWDPENVFHLNHNVAP
jgi:hypothetical protein